MFLLGLFHCSGIVKLTAQFVARNGAQFLDKLMMREQVRDGSTCVTACSCLLSGRGPDIFPHMSDVTDRANYVNVGVM